MNRRQRWILLGTSALAITVAVVVLAYCLSDRSDKPAVAFDLVPDIPPQGRGSLPPGANEDLEKRLQAAVSQRLLAAYRQLAYAASGKWSLATWAQLQFVRSSLDGEYEPGSAAPDGKPAPKIDPEFRDFSFVRVLHELADHAAPSEKSAAERALDEGTRVIGMLAATTPAVEDSAPATLHQVIAEIENSSGFRPFVVGFPKLTDFHFDNEF